MLARLDAAMVKRFHAIVRGRVQGVFYRVSAREQAMALKITGFVRNLPDGSVELDAQGEDHALDQFIHWCRHGPPNARVEHVEMNWLTEVTQAESFRVMS